MLNQRVESLIRQFVRDHVREALAEARAGGFPPLDTPKPPERPRVVCLCGSTRFADEFNRQNLRLTTAGVIVLSIGANVSDASLGIAQDSDLKKRLDELHLRKIDMADEILVINVGGYVGESTTREVEYARESGKRVTWLENDGRRLHGDLCLGPTTTNPAPAPEPAPQGPSIEEALKPFLRFGEALPPSLKPGNLLARVLTVSGCVDLSAQDFRLLRGAVRGLNAQRDAAKVASS